MRVIIVANGILGKTTIKSWLTADAYLIAADNGAHHCESENIVPDLLIGDLDSIDSAALAFTQQHKVPILRYPADKDYIDLELALSHALTLPMTEVIILGAEGGRSDMALMNMHLLALPDLQDKNITIVTNDFLITLVTPEKPLTINAFLDQIFSLIPLTPQVEGISTQGLYYPLKDDTLLFSHSKGISNRANDLTVMINIKKGLLVTFRAVNP